ncbi:ABC transporter permease [Microbacterium candidum]|uniref:ABC transporter permease n=1 Tax=Microbacterium candidum TaxID=3041922 RepID=A0ABT7N1H1_9MICO|nr:ABC transporter permease [Microbacterium sp. ASV49]MDL9980555.1 ABC transporter permease [Microbacterium sp. ASV49]
MSSSISTPPRTDVTGHAGYAADDPRNFYRPESEAELRAKGAKQRARRVAWVWAGRVLLFGIIFGGWQILATTKLPGAKDAIVDPFFYGKPSGIWDSFVKLFTQGTAFGSIWENLWVTIQEALGGFVLGTILGMIAGILLGSSSYLAAVAGPYIKVANAIPRIVLGAIFIVALGLGMPSKIVLAAVLVFFAVFFNAFQGVREVNPDLISNVRVLGASPMQVARHVTIPSAMTWIIASLHTAFGFAIIGALVGEVLGATSGIGLIISQAMGNFDPNTVWACMILIAAFTLVCEYLITLLEGRLLRWRPPQRSEAAAI